MPGAGLLVGSLIDSSEVLARLSFSTAAHSVALRRLGFLRDPGGASDVALRSSSASRLEGAQTVWAQT
eukprot:scaffold266862_cov35-Tisochrysis_lutea.AAC.4